MSNYYINAILLIGCPYSDRAQVLLGDNHFKKEITRISFQDKDKFKMENYNTYPQIFLKKENKMESLFIGGCDELESCIEIIKNPNNRDINGDIKIILNKYNIKWSKKARLRLIQLIACNPINRI